VLAKRAGPEGADAGEDAPQTGGGRLPALLFPLPSASYGVALAQS